MSNNKDFVVNGPVAIGKDTKVTVGSISAGTVDLSTGNYFVDSPTGDYTYSFANAGDVQAFQIQATGGSEAVAETFSTTLYTGNGTTQTIDNGLDLSGDGGLVWTKSRTTTSAHGLYDTIRGVSKEISSSSTVAQSTDNGVTAFNSNGYTVGNRHTTNTSAANYASWSFKKQTKFFDVVTYTGDGNASKTISHSLGSTPGFFVCKPLNQTGGWRCFHRSTGNDAYGQLNENYEFSLSDNIEAWAQTSPTDTNFTVGISSNTNNIDFVAYLFAHDTASDGLIQCGSYTGTASSVSINLGWQPQWLLIKRSDSAEDWSIVDNVRGMGTDPLLTGLKALTPNTSSAEEAPAYSPIVPSSTGFTAHTGYDARYCANGGTYIYMAIRAAAAPAITWPTNIEWPAGITPRTPAEGETDVYTFTTDDGGTTYTGVQSIDNAS